MDACVDEADPEKASVMLSMNDDWLHTLPYVQPPVRPEPGGRVLIYIGTPGKYMTMCIRSHKTRADHAYKGNRLVVVCRGVCMLPLGTQDLRSHACMPHVAARPLVSSRHAKHTTQRSQEHAKAHLHNSTTHK